MKLAGAYINDDTYEKLVTLSKACNRTLAGQCRHLFDRALKGYQAVPAAVPPQVEPASREKFDRWWNRRCADTSAHKTSLKEAMWDAFKAGKEGAEHGC